jgi:hypothetical protein
MSKLTPLVGVLLRKTVTNRLAASLEFDYAFSSNKTGNFEGEKTRNTGAFANNPNDTLERVGEFCIKARRCAFKVVMTYKFI